MKSVISALVKVRTFTTDSCAFAIQPIPSSVKRSQIRRTHDRARGPSPAGPGRRRCRSAPRSRHATSIDRSRARSAARVARRGARQRLGPARRLGLRASRGDRPRRRPRPARRAAPVRNIAQAARSATSKGRNALSSAPIDRCTRSCSARARRVEVDLGRNREQRDFAEPAPPRRRSPPRRVWLAVPEADGVQVLDQLDPVEDAAPDVARALEGVAPRRRQPRWRAAPAEPVEHLPVSGVAEQAAPDRRNGREPGIEVDEGLVRLALLRSRRGHCPSRAKASLTSPTVSEAGAPSRRPPALPVTDLARPGLESRRRPGARPMRRAPGAEPPAAHQPDGRRG